MALEDDIKKLTEAVKELTGKIQLVATLAEVREAAKTKTVSDAAPTEVVELTPPEAEVEEKKPAKKKRAKKKKAEPKGVTIEDINAAITTLVRSKRLAPVRAMMDIYGAAKTSDIPEDKIEQFYAELQGLLNGAEREAS